MYLNQVVQENCVGLEDTDFGLERLDNVDTSRMQKCDTAWHPPHFLIFRNDLDDKLSCFL